MPKNIKNSKHFCLDKGINSSVSRETIGDRNLFFGKNVIFKDGKLQSRAGLVPYSTNYIGKYSNSGQLKMPLTVTKTDYSYSNVSGKLAYDIWTDNQSSAYINVYLFRDTMALRSLGRITVGTVNGQFYNPQSVTFVTASTSNGNGLYVLVCCTPGPQTYSSGTFEIYEFAGDISGFTHVSDNSFYTPVLYTNGRGNNFSEARRNGWVFDDTPKYPEDVNLLTEKFRAYFSSDGYSSGFKLPLWELDSSKPCICRIYDTASQYSEWILPSNTHSATITFNNNSVTAALDCSTGYLRFTSQGTDYAIPASSKLNGNNIMLIAYKNIPDCRNAILSSKGAISFDDKVYLYGNGFYKNEIYCCDSSNPLYFPESMKTAVGNVTGEITAMYSKGKSLFAFKKDGIFKITSNEQMNKTEMEIPSDVGRNYHITNRLKSNELVKNIGCKSLKSICTCGDKIVFFSNNKKVYVLSDSGAINEISTPIGDLLAEISDSEINDCFLLSCEHNCFLFAANRSFLLDFKNAAFGLPTKFGNINGNESVKWHYLVFPDSQNYFSGITVGGKPYIICGDTNGKVSYVCKFSGNVDKVPDIQTTPNTLTEKRIELFIQTKSYDFDKPAAKKSILFTEFFVSGDGVYRININGNQGNSEQNISIKEDSVVRILPFLLPCYNVSADITGTAPFSLSKLTFEYNIKQ